jgi:hypothetical protein
MPFTCFLIFVIVININKILQESMSDSEIIWKFLSREYQDDHVAIYLYCSGNVRIPKTAIDRVLNFTKQIFCPAMSELLVKYTIIAYLDNKKRQYKRAEIKIKPLY